MTTASVSELRPSGVAVAPAERLTHASHARGKQRPSSMWLAGPFVFLAFFPYPAMPAGNSTGVQLSQLLALGLLPWVGLAAVGRRHRLSLFLVLLAAFLSAAVVLTTGYLTQPSLVYKTLGQIALSLVVMLPMARFAVRSRLPSMIMAVSGALVVHTLFTLNQVQSFAGNKFPLVSLYANPSFRDIAPVADRIATYEKRPFGYFPEPSAMTASIGPWIVLIVGVLAYPSLRARLSRRQIRFATVAVALAAVLLILGRSGNSVFIIAGALVAAGGGLRARGQRYGWSRVSLGVAVGGLGATPIAFLIVQGLLQRHHQAARGIDSWSNRLASIKAGLGFLGHGLREAWFGVGPGQGQVLILKEGVNASGAIWSDTARYIAETGLIGAAMLATVLSLAIRAVWRSGARLLGFCCLMVWVSSVALTTSYLELSPLWIFFGLLLVWERVVPRETEAPSGRRLEQDGGPAAAPTVGGQLARHSSPA